MSRAGLGRRTRKGKKEEPRPTKKKKNRNKDCKSSSPLTMLSLSTVGSCYIWMYGRRLEGAAQERMSFGIVSKIEEEDFRPPAALVLEIALHFRRRRVWSSRWLKCWKAFSQSSWTILSNIPNNRTNWRCFVLDHSPASWKSLLFFWRKSFYRDVNIKNNIKVVTSPTWKFGKIYTN